MVIVSHAPAIIFGFFPFDFFLGTQNSEEDLFLMVWFYL